MVHLKLMLQSSRTQLGLKALQNTTQKANEMAKLLSCQLGQPIVIRETNHDEYEESRNIQPIDGCSILPSPTVMVLKTTLAVSYELIPIIRKL